MGGYMVLGFPSPGVDAKYRGLDRDVPLVEERIGLPHPANQTLLKVLEDHEIPGLIPDLEVARALASAFSSGSGLGPFEVVEVTRPGERPEAGGRPLGYDVTFQEGSTSLLADILLWNDPLESRDEKPDPRVSRLRRQFAAGLNGSLLFDSEAEALEFFNAAMKLGPWEGPGIVWEVVGVWSVPAEDALAATSNSPEELQYVHGLLAEALSRGRSVDRLVFDRSAIMLHFLEDGPTAYLLIASSFELRIGDVTQVLDPELGGSSLHPALGLLGAQLFGTSVAASGDIRIEFQGGLSVLVPPNPRYEAWEVKADKWFKVVCMPGGAFAAWTYPASRDAAEGAHP